MTCSPTFLHKCTSSRFVCVSGTQSGQVEGYEEDRDHKKDEINHLSIIGITDGNRGVLMIAVHFNCIHFIDWLIS